MPLTDTLPIRVKHVGEVSVRAQTRSEQNHGSELQPNPIERGVSKTANFLTNLYGEYLYSSGLMLTCFCFWSLYPAYARFRHRHLCRFHSRQVTRRQWIFNTVHIAQWNKNYLDCITVRYNSTGVPLLADHHYNSLSRAAFSTACTFTCPTITLTRSSDRCVVDADAKMSHDRLQGELRLIQRQLQDVSCSTWENCQEILHPILHSAATKCGVRVVLVDQRDDTTTSELSTREKPPLEVWWLSSAEKKRREFCVFWCAVLLFLRIMQDAAYMPDMTVPN